MPDPKLDALKEVMAKNRIVFFNSGRERNPDYPELREANPLQKQLLEAWANEKYKVFTYLGANRIGKCLTFQTLIDTVDGFVAIGELFERGKPFDVWAWDGSRRVKSRAKAPFRKEGLHKCYRITMSDGQWVEAADHHRILCCDGSYRTVSELASLFPFYPPDTCGADQPLSVDSPCLQASSLEHGLSAPCVDVRRSSGKGKDYQGDCSEDSRQCGVQLRTFLDTFLFWIPSQAGVQPRDSALFCSGDLANICTSTHQLKFSRPSTLDVLRHYAGRCVDSGCRSACRTWKLFYEEYPLIVLRCPELLSLLLLDAADGLHQSLVSACNTPFVLGGNSIINITPIAAIQEVYDFEVEEYHNYFAGGMVHHNTTIGSIIAISTVAGEWPWNGKKLKFTHDLPRKVRYVGQGWESHIKTVVEPALKFWWPESYALTTKKNNQGIDATWQYHDDSGKLQGTIEIMSNSQDSSLFEGWHGDLIVYDEPPRREIRIAAARGLIDRNGRELFCCTLLSEAWLHREVIKAMLPDGSPDMTIYNISGDIYNNVGYGITQDGIDQFSKMLTDDEKQARIMGKPAYLSSLVCPKFSRMLHVKDRFTVPLDALIDISIDWHPSKPLAVVFLATLKSGFKYVTDEIKFRGPSKSAAEEIVRVIRQRDYARVNRVVIDPLSKSGEPNDTDTFSIFSETLAAYGYCLDVASKEKENGIAELNNLLWTENQTPALFFFKDCPWTIQEVEDMMYDPETFKPVKMNDDYFECLYRLCLMDTQWYPVFEAKSSGSCVVVL